MSTNTGDYRELLSRNQNSEDLYRSKSGMSSSTSRAYLQMTQQRIRDMEIHGLKSTSPKKKPFFLDYTTRVADEFSGNHTRNLTLPNIRNVYQTLYDQDSIQDVSQIENGNDLTPIRIPILQGNHFDTLKKHVKEHHDLIGVTGLKYKTRQQSSNLLQQLNSCLVNHIQTSTIKNELHQYDDFERAIDSELQNYDNSHKLQLAKIKKFHPLFSLLSNHSCQEFFSHSDIRLYNPGDTQPIKTSDIDLSKAMIIVLFGSVRCRGSDIHINQTLTLGETIGEEPFILQAHNIVLDRLSQIECLEKTGLLIIKFEDWVALKLLFTRQGMQSDTFKIEKYLKHQQTRKRCWGNKKLQEFYSVSDKIRLKAPSEHVSKIKQIMNSPSRKHRGYYKDMYFNSEIKEYQQ